MAVHKSAKKRIRSSARQALRNKSRMSQTRTSVRKVEEAIKSGDYTQAQDAFRAAQPILHRSGSKGLLHKRTVDRKLSRLSARVKALKKA